MEKIGEEVKVNRKGEGVLGWGGAKIKLRSLELKGYEKTLLPSVVGLSRVHGRWFDSDGQLSSLDPVFFFFFLMTPQCGKNVCVEIFFL